MIAQGEPIGPLASPGFWLHRAALDWLADLDLRLTQVGLTHAQFIVLAATSWVVGDGPGVSQQDIANFSKSDRATTSRVLRELETRRLVERVSNPASKRSVIVCMSSHGRELVKRATALARETDREFFAAIADVKQLRRLLEAVSRAGSESG